MKKTSQADLKTLLCADDTIAATPSDLAAIRTFANGVLSCYASLGDLQEPFKSQFVKVKDEINTVLAALPPTDQAPAASQANGILSQIMSMFQYTQSMITNLTAFAKAQQTERNTVLASMTTEVEKSAAEKLKTMLASGDYVAKADLDAKITDALAGAKTAWEAGLKIVSDRRTLLATEKLIVPGDDILAADAKDFDPKKVTAAARLEKLKPFSSLPVERLTTLAWLADDASFNQALADMEAAGGKKPAGGNPGAGAPLVPVPAKSVQSLRESYRKLGL